MASISSATLLPRQTTVGVEPTGPGPNDKYAIGSPCLITFNADTSGSETWKNLTIDLMTGANTNMVFLTNVATNIDGTDQSSSPITWTCPEVDPASQIYFYQFTHGNEEDPTWTTRFLITDADGNSVDPENDRQPGAKASDPNIPWGTGKIVGDVTTGTSGGSSSGVTSGSASSTNAASTSTFQTTITSSATPATMSTSATSSMSSSAAPASQATTDNSGAMGISISSTLSALVAVGVAMMML